MEYNDNPFRQTAYWNSRRDDAFRKSGHNQKLEQEQELDKIKNAMGRMTEKEKEKMMELLKFTFEEYFD